VRMTRNHSSPLNAFIGGPGTNEHRSGAYVGTGAYFKRARLGSRSLPGLATRGAARKPSKLTIEVVNDNGRLLQ
jgi:hypothetical protein